MSKLPESTKELKERLRRELLSPFDRGTLAFLILDWLTSLSKPFRSKQLLAQGIAKCLSAHRRFLYPKQSIERLIEKRPAELEALLVQTAHEEVSRLALSLQTNDRKRRVKIESERERIKRVRSSKRLYECKRSADFVGDIGLIEQQFSKEPTVSFFNPFGQCQGNCVDGLFAGGEVQMSSGWYSLQSLFGRSRKLLRTLSRNGKTAVRFFMTTKRF
jgi:hypothetical protein